MIGLGIIVGLFVWGLVGSLVSCYVLRTPQAGVPEGLAAAIWAVWPFFHSGRVKRYNFLHPVPRCYKVPLKQAFAKIRQVIGDKTYKFGDKWHVSTADTMQRRITANLRFADEESHIDGSSLANIHSRTQRVQRLIELDVQMKEEPNDSTVVQLDFHPKVEGLAWNACDAIVAGIANDVEAVLGPGTNAGSPADTTFPAPPWWLIAVGALGAFVLFCDVVKAVFGS